MPAAFKTVSDVAVTGATALLGIPSGSIGICCIGVIGGYYFARFFDQSTSLTGGQLATLLTILGVGPTALVLVQGYFRLSLLDPYGIGLAVGVAINFTLRNRFENARLRALVPPSTLEAAAGAGPRSEAPKISFLETVSATASAGPPDDETARAIERRIAAQIARQAVEHWLGSEFPEGEVQSKGAYLDFFVRTADRRIGIELRLGGQSRAVLNILLRQFLSDAKNGFDANEFDEAWVILAWSDVQRAKSFSALLSGWKPGPQVRAIVGIIDDEGTFRPVDHTAT